MSAFYFIPEIHPVGGGYGGETLSDRLGTVCNFKLVTVREEDIRIERKKEKREKTGTPRCRVCLEVACFPIFYFKNKIAIQRD